MQVRMLRDMFGADRTLYVAGQTYELADGLALSFIGAGAASDVGTAREDQQETMRVDWLTAAQIAVGATGVAGVKASGVPVGPDGSQVTLSRVDTQFPAERVSMSASGCACGSPCQVVRIRCTSGTGVALTVYDNPAASSGTQLYSGTLSSGQEAPILTPIRAINGVRAVFASGAFDFYILQEI